MILDSMNRWPNGQKKIRHSSGSLGCEVRFLFGDTMKLRSGANRWGVNLAMSLCIADNAERAKPQWLLNQKFCRNARLQGNECRCAWSFVLQGQAQTSTYSIVCFGFAEQNASKEHSAVTYMLSFASALQDYHCLRLKYEYKFLENKERIMTLKRVECDETKSELVNICFVLWKSC